MYSINSTNPSRSHIDPSSNKVKKSGFCLSKIGFNSNSQNTSIIISSAQTNERTNQSTTFYLNQGSSLPSNIFERASPQNGADRQIVTILPNEPFAIEKPRHGSQNAQLAPKNDLLVSSLSIQNARLTSENKLLNSKNELIASQNGHLSSQNAQLTSENKSLNSKNASLTSQNTLLTEENNNLNQALIAKTEENRNTKKLNDLILINIDIIGKNITSVQSELEESKKQIEMLEQKLRLSEKKNKELAEEIKTSKESTHKAIQLSAGLLLEADKRISDLEQTQLFSFVIPDSSAFQEPVFTHENYGKRAIDPSYIENEIQPSEKIQRTSELPAESEETESEKFVSEFLESYPESPYPWNDGSMI